MGMRSRLQRLHDSRRRRTSLYRALAVGGAAVAVVALVAAGVLASQRPAPGAEANAESGAAEATAVPVAAEPSVTASDILLPAPVEVPDVVGMPVDDAEAFLAMAGFVVERMGTPPGSATPGTVVAQDPVAGTLVSQGMSIAVTFADPQATVAVATRARAVVCIDPGHQGSANLAKEPIGPGSAETKPKVTGGATGVATKQPEHELVLAIAKKVQRRLEARGVEVVMTRTVADVDISNRERAEVANAAAADLFLRIHADSNVNADVTGVSTLYPGGNSWVEPIESRSLEAARAVQAATVAATGARDRGVARRADLSGFNWARVPAILVECGFLSNAAEDRRLADPAYQDRLADGISAGVLRYLGM